MYIDINLDPESEKVSIVYDGSISVYSYIDGKGHIQHKNYDLIDDPDIECILTTLSSSLLDYVKSS